MNLDETPTPADTVGLLDGIATTRSIRRYLDEAVPESILRDVCFAASRAANGSDRQAFRVVGRTEGPDAQRGERVVADGAKR